MALNFTNSNLFDVWSLAKRTTNVHFRLWAQELNSLWPSDAIWCQGSRSTLASGNPTLWRGVSIAPIQKSFGSSKRDWKPRKKLQIPCKFCTNRFIRCSSTCYDKVRIDPLMVYIRNPDFFASPVHWGEPHEGCNCNHRQHGRGEESAAKCFRFVPLV